MRIDLRLRDSGVSEANRRILHGLQHQRPLWKRIGAALMKWEARLFATEGLGRWRPAAPETFVQRHTRTRAFSRRGAGLRKRLAAIPADTPRNRRKRARIRARLLATQTRSIERFLAPSGDRRKRHRLLQDRGILRESANYVAVDDHVTFGYGDRKAIWHHGGTEPYPIRPKRRRALRWWTRSGPVFARAVDHPGLPARPLLPTEADLAVEIGVPQIVQDYVNRLGEGRSG